MGELIPTIFIPGITGNTIVNSNTLDFQLMYSAISRYFKNVEPLSLKIDERFETDDTVIGERSHLEHLAYADLELFINKGIRLFLAFLFIISVASAQKTELKDSLSKTIVPFYSSNAMLQLDTIHIRIRVVQDLKDADTLITFQLSALSFPNHPSLQDAGIVAPVTKRSAGSYIDTCLVVITQKMRDTLSRDEFGVIRIKGNDVFIQLRLSATSDYDRTKPFWVEVGANIDLIDGLKTNNLFFGVFYYKRDIRQIFNCPHTLGIIAGTYESKTITTSSVPTFELKTYYNSNSLTHPNSDSAYVFRDVGQVKTNQVVRNVSMFFSPQVRLSNGLSNQDGFHFFLSLWAEIQWQKLESSFDYSDLKRVDTISIHVNDIQKYQGLNTGNSFETYTHYEGIGIPMFIMEGDYNLFLNPVFGISNQVNADNLNKDTPDLKKTTKGFYIVQFRLNEEKYGIAFSGEVRALFAKNNTPFITLVFSKKFDLKKFLEFK